MNYLNRIEINPKIMMGKPVIKGTRIPIYVILKLLGEGYNFEKILKEYPDLTYKDILAVLNYAAKVFHFEQIEEKVSG
jgi:uncharacterized protein (DUF433 family)